MRRRIDAFLTAWKENPDRRALLVRGARQVGKTYSVRNLGESFPHFLEVNFEEDPALQSFFEGSLDPVGLCEKLSAYRGIPIEPGRTLLFFDEVQACPKALSSLRFFHERMPDLHVAAAGSLLEFALNEIPSQGVGRIESLFMYPMTFAEFLLALKEDALSDMIAQADTDHPLDNPFHKRIVEYLKTYQLIGGMPAVVRRYASEHDLNACMSMLDGLIETVRDDFAKYKKRSPMLRLSEVFRSIAYQGGNKFKYSNVDSSSSSPSIKNALDLLVQAGLAYKVHHSSARGIPLGAQVKSSRFKVLPLDIGLHQRLLGLDIAGYLVADEADLINKGSLAEVCAGLELIHSSRPYVRPNLYYWHREARGSQAEVDYVIQKDNRIIPIEVKAGKSGRMRSMHIFLKERNLDKGLRVSFQNFSAEGSTESLPLYAISRLTEA